MNQKERNIEVWIRNAGGDFLIVRRITNVPGIPCWEPILTEGSDKEPVMETAVRGTWETVGLTLTPAMGEFIGMADGKDYGLDEPIITLRFDYQNEDLDTFCFGNPEIQSALWASPAQIHELIRAGLWNQTDPIPGLTSMIGPMIPFGQLNRHEMRIAIDSNHLLTDIMLRQKIFPEATRLSVSAMEQIRLWASKWNLTETDASARHLIYAYNQSARGAFLLKQYDEARQAYQEELRILEQHGWKEKTSSLLRRMAETHGLLELVLMENGNHEDAKRERKMRYDLLRECRRLEEEKRTGEQLRSAKVESDEDDLSIMDDSCLSTTDDLNESVTCCHSGSDQGPVDTLTISDGFRGRPVTKLTGLLHTNLDNLQIVDLMGTSIRDIIGNPFAGCKNLREIHLSPDHHAFRMVGNCLMTGDGRRLILHLPAAPDTVCEVPEGTIVIGRDAFHGCVNLEKIVLPAGVRIIDGNAFYRCDLLSEISLPDSLVEIGAWAFAGCRALTKIRIPSSVRRIEEFAFSESGLESVIFPEKLDLLDSYAFSFCENLTQADLPVVIRESGDSVFEGSPIDAQFPPFKDNDTDCFQDES